MSAFYTFSYISRSLHLRNRMVGHETSAASRMYTDIPACFSGTLTRLYTVSLTLLDLARNQPAQRKLREEVLSLGDNTLDFDAVQKLEYLDAVVREGLVPQFVYRRLTSSHQVFDFSLISSDCASIPLHHALTVWPSRTTSFRSALPFTPQMVVLSLPFPSRLARYTFSLPPSTA